MKKIISDEIERLKQFRKENRGSAAVGEQLLGRAGDKQYGLESLLKKHPALDDADDLLEIVSTVAKMTEDCHCTAKGNCVVCKAQALINEIEKMK